ncbi:peroxide stress protein YaaA [Ideonella sp. DXS22W]|uniref:UPF0246 protein AACH10_03075 n=1 Tax=Pseudaquabacterium inlustre TaxID=2984192 RepID=A0ABU9CBF5_9BURK
MLFLLSPAKTLDYERPLPAGVGRRATEPAFVPRAAELIDGLKTLTPPQLAQLMDLSDELAALNVGRYAAWTPEHGAKNSRPAAYAFNGDVYDGLDIRTLEAADLTWAQQHVVILSGLYGALRPFDRLQPYRLEMGTRWANAAGKDLYAYWGDTVASYLNERQADERSPVVVNLASQEYFKVADRRALKARVVECQFEDWKAGQYKIISFFAKRARGAFARWAIQHRVRSVAALQGFDADGYAFDAGASTPDRLVFRRRTA